MLSTHIDAEKRYHSIRSETLRQAQKKLSARSEYTDLILRTFDSRALSISKTWEKSRDRWVDWDWLDGYSAFKFRYPKRFELAVWHKNTLASLTLGRPTYRGTALRLDFIEASPLDKVEFSVFPVTLVAMTAYAKALGATSIRVMNPINDEVKRYYESMGLVYVTSGDYLYTRV